jgi:hypothetical protein
MRNFVSSSLWDFKSSFTCLKILRHGTFPLYFPSERNVYCGFVSPLKIHRFGRVLNPQTLGPVASTLTTRPPRRRIASCNIWYSFFGFTPDVAGCPRILIQHSGTNIHIFDRLLYNEELHNLYSSRPCPETGYPDLRFSRLSSALQRNVHCDMPRPLPSASFQTLNRSGSMSCSVPQPLCIVSNKLFSFADCSVTSRNE